MTIAEQIYELVKSLPQERANQVLAFAESIHAEYLNTDASTEADPLEDWAVLVYSLDRPHQDIKQPNNLLERNFPRNTLHKQIR